MQKGKLVEHYLDAGSEIDSSDWINIDDYECKTLRPLGELPEPSKTKSLSQHSIRRTFKDPNLQETAELSLLIKNLNDITSDGLSKDHQKTSKILEFFSAIKNEILKTNKKGAIRTDLPEPSIKGAKGKSTNSKGIPSQHRNIFSRLRSAFSHFLMASALGQIIGNEHAKYVQRLMDLFGNEDLNEALLKAIPLKNLQDVIGSSPPKMGRITGRNKLDIRPFSSSGKETYIDLAHSYIDQLRAMYEAAFKRLDQRGEYKNAAFVLAELLRDIDRAVNYLEKHEQFQLAAELAEGQGLSAARIIRQWIIANNITRAMQIALISNCFEEAITALEQKYKKQADLLRWHAAQLHHQAGNYEVAIEIAWPLNEKRDEVIAWLKESFLNGGQLGARHLVRLALHDDENYRDYIYEINLRFREGNSYISLGILEEISKQGVNPRNRRIASLATRAYLLEIANGRLRHDTKLWNQLCFIAEDLALKEEVKHFTLGKQPQRQLLTKRDDVSEIVFDETFGRKASDCALLTNGDVLVAFGEAGVELWNSSGEKKAFFSVPCHNIVIHDYGTQALLIGKREGYKVVHQFDFVKLSTKHWLDIKIDCWADNYDGLRWIVSCGEAIWILDTLRDEQTILWSVSDFSSPILRISRTQQSFAFYFENADKLSVWSYMLPDLLLKERRPYKRNEIGNIKPVAISSKGVVAGVELYDATKYFLIKGDGINLQINDNNSEDIDAIHLYNEWLIIITTLANTLSVNLHADPKLHNKSPLKTLRFPGTTSVNIRFTDTALLINHADGRIVTMDLNFGDIVSDFTV